MKIAATVLILIGFCLGTLGAAGFQAPVESASLVKKAMAGEVPGHPMTEIPEEGKLEAVRERLVALRESVEDSDAPADAELRAFFEAPVEAGAPWMFGGGILLLILGGFLTRLHTTSTLATESQAGRQVLQDRIAAVRDQLVSLHGNATAMGRAQVQKELTELIEGPMYDLTSEFEHWTKLLGFETYTRIWEHVASGERLTHRAWTLYTDGYPEEGHPEIQFAHEAFEAALAACRA